MWAMETRQPTAEYLDIKPAGPPAGFSKGVNDSLISMSSLAHFKAAGILGFALTLTGLLLADHITDPAAWYCHMAGILLLVLSAGCSALVILPAQSVRSGGRIFWADIVTHASAESYVESLRALGPASADAEYAATNYHLSQVLVGKFKLVRWSVASLMAGCMLAALARIFA